MLSQTTHHISDADTTRTDFILLDAKQSDLHLDPVGALASATYVTSFQLTEGLAMKLIYCQ